MRRSLDSRGASQRAIASACRRPVIRERPRGIRIARRRLGMTPEKQLHRDAYDMRRTANCRPTASHCRASDSSAAAVSAFRASQDFGSSSE